MKIGIIGLGLIGGSLAMSIRRHTEHTVFGYDINDEVVMRARAVEAIHEELTDDMVPLMDVVLVALFPQLCADYIISHADSFRKGALVVDCAGVKRHVCNQIEPVAAQHDFIYIGGHPMAGREFSGFDAARPSLFDNASMILCPGDNVGIKGRALTKDFFLEIGFKTVRFCTAAEHDQMIAYTSQLAHVVSGAYVKNPLSKEHAGFSAGSFRDMTRVARLNEVMWTELFLENIDLLLPTLDDLIARLNGYRDALASGDPEKIIPVLREGRECKEALD